MQFHNYSPMGGNMKSLSQPATEELNTSCLFQNTSDTYIRSQACMKLTGIKKSTWFALQDPNSPQFDSSFPESHQITARTRVWRKKDLINWVESKKYTRSSKSELVGEH